MNTTLIATISMILCVCAWFGLWHAWKTIQSGNSSLDKARKDLDSAMTLVGELRSKLNSKDLELVRLKQELRSERRLQQIWRARCNAIWNAGQQFDAKVEEAKEDTGVEIVSVTEEPANNGKEVLAKEKQRSFEQFTVIDTDGSHEITEEERKEFDAAFADLAGPSEKEKEKEED